MQVEHHLHRQKMEQGLVVVLELGLKDWEQEKRLFDWVCWGMKTRRRLHLLKP